MTLAYMTNLAAETPPLLRLYTEDPVAGHPVYTPWILLSVGVLLALAWVLSRLAWTGGVRATPAERAFIMLARSMKIGSESVALVRKLARIVEVEPVGLLVSETSFSRALEMAARSPDRAKALNEREKQAALLLQARAFAGEGDTR